MHLTLATGVPGREINNLAIYCPLAQSPGSSCYRNLEKCLNLIDPFKFEQRNEHPTAIPSQSID